jgi:hypothetical protein
MKCLLKRCEPNEIFERMLNLATERRVRRAKVNKSVMISVIHRFAPLNFAGNAKSQGLQTYDVARPRP